MTVPVRKFEPGATVDYLSDFMEKCGYQISAYGGMVYRVKQIGMKGPGRKMSRSKVIELFDQERVKKGLEPIKAIHVKQSKLKVTSDA